MKILSITQIGEILARVDVLQEIEAGFVAYSRGQAVVPPVGELLLEEPPGEVHLKYGYLRGQDHYVIKIASGFPANSTLGLPTGNGLMLLFSQQSGELVSVLLDEGHLTDVRTAAAGALAAKVLASPQCRRIGVLGTGVQARLQLDYLRQVTPCRKATIFGRSSEARERFAKATRPLGFDLDLVANPREVAEVCDLIVTTTPTTTPLLRPEDIRPGTHITAVGSDTPEKQELDAGILGVADVVVADSLSQCRLRGEISHALRSGLLAEEDVVELGAVIDGHSPGRSRDDQISVADLTGVAVQDIQIASAIYRGAVDSETESLR